MNYSKIHAFWGSDEYQDRRAEVEFNKDRYTVHMYKNNKLVESRLMVSKGVVHSETYAENAAENFVMGIIQ